MREGSLRAFVEAVFRGEKSHPLLERAEHQGLAENLIKRTGTHDPAGALERLGYHPRPWDLPSQVPFMLDGDECLHDERDPAPLRNLCLWSAAAYVLLTQSGVPFSAADVWLLVGALVASRDGPSGVPEWFASAYTHTQFLPVYIDTV